MSNSWNCEQELRRLASELYNKAQDLEDAANVLETLRSASGLEEQITSAKKWAKSWMKSDVK